jgi:tetratricopeptide (TPR) repeat protein
MLLDQKKTRRRVQIVSIIAALAFVGVIFVVLGLIVFGGGSSEGGGPEDLIGQAQEQTRQAPRSADAWEDLASAYAANQEFDKAIAPAERAVSLAPDDFSRVQTLVSLLVQNGQNARAVTVLQSYTRRNPNNPDAFIELGLYAEEAGRRPLATLAYSTFLRLAPEDTRAPEVRQRLRGLRGGGSPTTSTPAPTTSTPATPATP